MAKRKRRTFCEVNANLIITGTLCEKKQPLLSDNCQFLLASFHNLMQTYLPLRLRTRWIINHTLLFDVNSLNAHPRNTICHDGFHADVSSFFSAYPFRVRVSTPKESAAARIVGYCSRRF